MLAHIHNSNLIEGIDSHEEDLQSCEAWAYLVGRDRLTVEVVLRTHMLITVNQLPHRESGVFRDVAVTVGGQLCPAPHLAKELVHNWVIDMQQFWRTLDPKEMHIRFEQTHPFIDGNGRTGRMLMWWHERMLGLKPTLIKASERDKYYEWFRG